MSRALSTNSGSLDSSNASDRCGCSPNACRIRRAVVCESPASRAIDRIDQCVASGGDVSSVRLTTPPARASSMLRGRPELDASDRPSTRSFGKRRRHLPTVCSCTPSSTATALLVKPSAQRRTAAAVRHPPRHPAAANPALKERPLFGAQHRAPSLTLPESAIATDNDTNFRRRTLEFHVEGILEDGEDVPSPRDRSQVMADPELASWLEGADIVDVDIETPSGQLEPPEDP